MTRRARRCRTVRGVPARACVAVLGAALLVGVLAGPATARPAAAAAVPGCAGAHFHPLAPVRVYDSANPGSARVGQAPVAVDLSSVLADGACAVVATLTGAAATSTTYVTAYPDGTARPLASNLNLRPGADSADLVTVAVGSTPAIDLYVNQGTARLVVDVAG